jgi:acyl dehydratase
MNDAAPAQRAISLADLSALAGKETGVSRWFDIPQSRINDFADVTEDHQFIHVDPEAAKATPFGGAIAHGFLTLSMLSAIAYDAVPRVAGVAMGVNYGFDKVRFIAPVPAGGRIRGRFKLVSVEPRSATEHLSRSLVVIEIEGVAKPALSAEWLTLYVMPPEVSGATT